MTTDPEEQSAEDDKAKMVHALLPVRVTSTVVRGFGRGSKELGIPTANLDPASMCFSNDDSSTSTVTSKEDFPCGIYWGFGRINSETPTLTCAVSVGYNPTYANKEKTIEPHLIAPASDPRRHASSTGETVLHDFYDKPMRLSVVGYLRPELPFEGLDKLVEAIKADIQDAVRLAEAGGDVAAAERAWVDSDVKVTD